MSKEVDIISRHTTMPHDHAPIALSPTPPTGNTGRAAAIILSLTMRERGEGFCINFSIVFVVVEDMRRASGFGRSFIKAMASPASGESDRISEFIFKETELMRY